MQIQETIEYDVKTLLHTLLDTMKSLRHTDNLAYSKPVKLRRVRARFNQRRPDEIQKENKERWLKCQNLT